jgi:hypothetical protein
VAQGNAVTSPSRAVARCEIDVTLDGAAMPVRSRYVPRGHRDVRNPQYQPASCPICPLGPRVGFTACMPSNSRPGIVYPTLTYFEEAGYIAAEPQGSEKLYTIIAAGRDHLAVNRDFIEVLARAAADLRTREDQP